MSNLLLPGLRLPEPISPMAAALLGEAHYLICSSMPLTADLLDCAPWLRFFQKFGAGVDSINVQVVWARQISCCNTVGVDAVGMAESVLLLMLAVLRRLPYTDHWLRSTASPASLMGGGSIPEVARTTT